MPERCRLDPDAIASGSTLGAIVNGRVFVAGFILFAILFGVALFWFQYYAWYERSEGGTEITVGGEVIAVSGLDQIDASTSPLKLRACFNADPADFEGFPQAPEPIPLTPPGWFDCFDAEQIDADIASGNARALLLTEDDPKGFDTVAAIYADGRGFLWRQLNERFH